MNLWYLRSNSQDNDEEVVQNPESSDSIQGFFNIWYPHSLEIKPCQTI